MCRFNKILQTLAVIVAVCFLPGWGYSAPTNAGETPKPRKPGQDIDYTRILYNVKVTGRFQLALGEPQRALQTLLVNLKERYSAPFCGIDPVYCDISGPDMKDVAAKKGKIGLILQVGVTDAYGEWSVNFDSAHAMLIKTEKGWQPIFEGPIRSISSTELSRNEGRQGKWNPAEIPFLRAMLPAVIEDVTDIGDGQCSIKASVKNRLPFEVKNLRIRFPHNDSGPERHRIFEPTEKVVIPPDARKTFTLEGPGRRQALNRQVRFAYVEYDLKDPKPKTRQADKADDDKQQNNKEPKDKPKSPQRVSPDDTRDPEDEEQ